MYDFIRDLFMVIIVFFIIIALFAVVGFPLLIFILGNANIKAIMIIVAFIISMIITHYKNEYEKEKERGNE
jgi:ABC-type nitrate/sulfonate/bicarbonate transport system permease component